MRIVFDSVLFEHPHEFIECGYFEDFTNLHNVASCILEKINMRKEAAKFGAELKGLFSYEMNSAKYPTKQKLYLKRLSILTKRSASTYGFLIYFFFKFLHKDLEIKLQFY